MTSDEPILGRQVVGGRPAAWLRMEDKIFAEEVWREAGVPAEPHHVVPVDRDALARATAAVAGPLGAVWSGDARDGFNGAGNYVRWVADDADQDAAYAFFAPRCDRVRVMPFLDGVPCSIHGIVVPDGTAVFRPVEIVMLRKVGAREFVYGGLSTYWDPPTADREEMRAVARRVGHHLQSVHGYRGAFGIDGVLTADGFRPTELNTRMSAGLGTIASVGAGALLARAGAPRRRARHRADASPTWSRCCRLMDAERSGRAVALGDGVMVPGPDEYPVQYDGTTLCRADHDTGNVLVVGNTPTGFFAKLSAGSALRPGDRVAPLNVALVDHVDREYAAGLGPVVRAAGRALTALSRGAPASASVQAHPSERRERQHQGRGGEDRCGGREDLAVADLIGQQAGNRRDHDDHGAVERAQGGVRACLQLVGGARLAERHLVGVAGAHRPAVAQLSGGQDRCPGPARRRRCRRQHDHDPERADRVRADDRAARAQAVADRGAHRSAEQRAETRDGEHEAQLQGGEAQLQVAVGDDEHDEDRLAREPHVRRDRPGGGGPMRRRPTALPP